MTHEELIAFYSGKSSDNPEVKERAAKDIFYVLYCLQTEEELHKITQECYLNSCQKLLTANTQLARETF